MQALNAYANIPEGQRGYGLAERIDGAVNHGVADVDAADYDRVQGEAYRPFAADNNPDNYSPGRYIEAVHAEGQMAQRVARDSAASRGNAEFGEHGSSRRYYEDSRGVSNANDHQNLVDAARAMDGQARPDSYVARDANLSRDFGAGVRRAYGAAYESRMPTQEEVNARLEIAQAENDARMAAEVQQAPDAPDAPEPTQQQAPDAPDAPEPTQQQAPDAPDAPEPTQQQAPDAPDAPEPTQQQAPDAPDAPQQQSQLGTTDSPEADSDTQRQVANDTDASRGPSNPDVDLPDNKVGLGVTSKGMGLVGMTTGYNQARKAIEEGDAKTRLSSAETELTKYEKLLEKYKGKVDDKATEVARDVFGTEKPTPDQVAEVLDKTVEMREEASYQLLASQGRIYVMDRDPSVPGNVELNLAKSLVKSSPELSDIHMDYKEKYITMVDARDPGIQAELARGVPLKNFEKQEYIGTERIVTFTKADTGEKITLTQEEAEKMAEGKTYAEARSEAADEIAANKKAFEESQSKMFASIDALVADGQEKTEVAEDSKVKETPAGEIAPAEEVTPASESKVAKPEQPLEVAGTALEMGQVAQAAIAGAAVGTGGGRILNQAAKEMTVATESRIAGVASDSPKVAQAAEEKNTEQDIGKPSGVEIAMVTPEFANKLKEIREEKAENAKKQAGESTEIVAEATGQNQDKDSKDKKKPDDLEDRAQEALAQIAKAKAAGEELPSDRVLDNHGPKPAPTLGISDDPSVGRA